MEPPSSCMTFSGVEELPDLRDADPELARHGAGVDRPVLRDKHRHCGARSAASRRRPARPVPVGGGRARSGRTGSVRYRPHLDLRRRPEIGGSHGFIDWPVLERAAAERAAEGQPSPQHNGRNEKKAGKCRGAAALQAARPLHLTAIRCSGRPPQSLPPWWQLRFPP